MVLTPALVRCTHLERRTFLYVCLSLCVLLLQNAASHLLTARNLEWLALAPHSLPLPPPSSLLSPTLHMTGNGFHKIPTEFESPTDLEPPRIRYQMTGACVCVFACPSWMSVTILGEPVATDGALLRRAGARRGVKHVSNTHFRYHRLQGKATVDLCFSGKLLRTKFSRALEDVEVRLYVELGNALAILAPAEWNEICKLR